MKIKLENYIIELNSFQGYDLIKIGTVAKGDNAGRETFTIIGYAMAMKNCIKKIVHLNLAAKESELTLKEFLEEYKKETTRMVNLIKDVD